MKITFSLVLLLVSVRFGVWAQHPVIKPFIEAWKVADTSQSSLAQAFYDSLHLKKDTARYLQVIDQLYKYLKDHPDKRLEARTIVYQTLGALEFSYTIGDRYIGLMQKAIRLAGELEDDQLAAEIYSLYAGMAGPENYLLYNLKAIELQRRIGLQHFFYVYTRLFDVSRALYLNQDYRKSITYGLECLNTKVTDRNHYDPLVYVYQLDILGACYKKLGQYDSAEYYYNNLIAHVPDATMDTLKKALWLGIGKGNLGHILLLQGKYDTALSLVKGYLKSSVDYGDQLNIAMAQNYLGCIYYNKKQYAPALAAWRQAYYRSLQSGSLENSVQAAQGIAGIFRLTGKTDSAYYYYDLFHRYKDSLTATLSQLQLSVMKARIAFDELHTSLNKSQAALQKERTTRNFIIAGILLSAFSILLLYNRRRLKQQYTLQQVRQRQQQAEQEIKSAREQIASFTNHIIEKNDLIETLEAQIDGIGQQQHQQAILVNLQEYTLLTDTEWEKFKLEFARAYPGFLTRLRQRISQITPAEERLATLLFLQLNTYQIASALGIGRESVLRSKRRLKQRLQLPDPVTVEEYLFNLLSANS